MEGSKRFEWSAMEHHHEEKSVDWYWGIGIVAIAIAERFGCRILFREFLVKGLPLMIATTLVASGVFYLRIMFLA